MRRPRGGNLSGCSDVASQRVAGKHRPSRQAGHGFPRGGPPIRPVRSRRLPQAGGGGAGTAARRYAARAMDLRRLRAGEWVAAASGVALLVSLFLPWYGGAGGDAHRLGVARGDRRPARPRRRRAACCSRSSPPSSACPPCRSPFGARDVAGGLFGVAARPDPGGRPPGRRDRPRVGALARRSPGRSASWPAARSRCATSASRRPAGTPTSPAARSAAPPELDPIPAAAAVSIEPGIERTDEFTAEGRLLTDVGGTLGVKVLSTPGMIAMMERCASILAFENLPDGQATVGLRGLRQARGRGGRGQRLHRARPPGRGAWTGASCASPSRSARATGRSAWAPTSAAWWTRPASAADTYNRGP